MGDLYRPSAGAAEIRDALEQRAFSSLELQDLLLFKWTRTDEPATEDDEAVWIWIFRQAGFFSRGSPEIRHMPTAPVRLFRGSTAARAHRMSWSDQVQVAEVLSVRHAKYGESMLYAATVRPSSILAYLFRPAEGWTVVVDTGGLPAELDVVKIIT